MEETNTQIAWPSKLKIGAKSKKGKTMFGLPVIVYVQKYTNSEDRAAAMLLVTVV